ncbi:MAG: DUF1501 domain-containing protein [Phycisphaerae bacterium]|nr:DUF1501 domain-containing protein [Phycisphaerae bacterium]
MNPADRAAFTRRQFLTTGLTLASASAAVPWFLQRSAFGLPHAAAGMRAIPGVDQDRVLVVVQLGGGNDGLNMVIPYGDPTYYKARPTIGVAQERVLKLGDDANGVGLHPQMRPMKELYDEGVLSLVQGVGYPNPNRSHFKSMDIWHTADLSGTGSGWLGRYFDAECSGEAAKPGDAAAKDPASGHNPQIGVAVGREAPLAMQGSRIAPLSFETPDLFRWIGSDVHKTLADPYKQITRQGVAENIDPHSNAGFLMRTALDAQVSSDLIRKAVSQPPLVAYPNSDLARQLAMVGSMIRAGLSTRVYYVTMGGFDTHAGQGGENGRHANLLQQFAAAVGAFYKDLKAQRNHERVLTMTFSEFGRRVYQNASGGTDHGTAAPMFLVGPMVSPGVLTRHPSLNDLDDGDLKFNTDFRSVYAGVLESWLKADSKKILEEAFKPAPVMKRA